MTKAILGTLFRVWCVCAILVITSACTLTREEYRDNISDTICDRAMECEKIGEGKTFEDYDACLKQRQKDIDSLWPAEQCTASIAPEQFDVCNNEAKKISCFYVDGSFTEYVDFLNKCAADKVCTQ